MGCQSAKSNIKYLTTHKASLGSKFILTLEYQCKLNLLEEENIASAIQEFHLKFPSEKTFKIEFFVSFLNKNINKTTEIPVDFYLDYANNKNKESEAYINFNRKYLTFALDFSVNLTDLDKLFSSFENPIKTKICFFNDFFKFQKKFSLSIKKIENFLDFTYLTDITLNLEWKNPKIKNKNFTKEIKFAQRLIIHGEYYFDALDFSKIEFKNALMANTVKDAFYSKESGSTVNKTLSLMDPEKAEIVDFSRFKAEEEIDFLLNCALKHLENTNILLLSKKKSRTFQSKFAYFQRFLHELSKLELYADKLNYYLEKSLKMLIENLRKISVEKNADLRDPLLSMTLTLNYVNLNNNYAKNNKNNYNYNSDKENKKLHFENMILFIIQTAEKVNKNLLISNMEDLIKIAFDDFFAENLEATKLKILTLAYSLQQNNFCSVAKISEFLAAKQHEIFWFIFKKAFKAPESRIIFKFILDLFFAVEKKIINLNEKSKSFYYFKFLKFEEKINQEFLEKMLLVIKSNFTFDKNVFFKNFYLYSVEYFHPVYYLLAIKKFRLLIQENKEKFYKLFIEVLEIQNKENFITQADEREEANDNIENKNSKENFDYGLLKDFFYNLADLTEMEFKNQNLLLDLIYTSVNQEANNSSNLQMNNLINNNNSNNNNNNSYLTSPNPKHNFNNLASNVYSHNNMNNISNYDYYTANRMFNNINNNNNLVSTEGNFIHLRNMEVLKSVNIFNNNLISKENEYYLKHAKFIKFYKFIKSYVKNFGEHMLLAANMTFKADNNNPNNNHNNIKQNNFRNLDITYYDENEKNIFLEVSKSAFALLLKEKIFKKLQRLIASATHKKNILTSKKNNSNSNKKYSRDYASVNNITNNNQINNNNNNSRNTDSQFWLNNDNFDIESYLDDTEKADISNFLNENLKKILIENLICNEEISLKLEDLIVFLYPVFQSFFKEIFVFSLETLFCINALQAKDLIYIADFNFEFIFDLFTNGTFSFKLSEKIKEAIENKPILMELFEHKINKQFLEEFILKNLKNFFKFNKKDFAKLNKNYVKAPETMLNTSDLQQLFKKQFVYKNTNFLVSETLVKERIQFLKLFFEFDQVSFFFDKFKEFFQSLILNVAVNLKTNKSEFIEIYGIEDSMNIERNVFYLFYNLFFEDYFDLEKISLKALKAYVPLQIEENDVLLIEENLNLNSEFSNEDKINFINENRNSNKLLKIRQSLESQSVRISSIGNSGKMSDLNRNPGEALEDFEQLNEKVNNKNSENLINFNDNNSNKNNNENSNAMIISKKNLINEVNKETFFSLHKIKFINSNHLSKLKNPNELLSAESALVKFNQNRNVALLFNAKAKENFYLTHIYMKNPLIALKENKIFAEKELKQAVKSALFLGGCGEFPNYSEIEKLKSFKLADYLSWKANLNNNNEKNLYNKYFEDRFFYLGFIEFDYNENENEEKYFLQKAEKLYSLDYLFVLLLNNFVNENEQKDDYLFCGNIGCLGNFDRNNAEKIMLRDYKFLKEKFLDENYKDFVLEISND